MFIVKTVGPNNIESCGFVTEDALAMIKYCAGVEANIFQYIFKIKVYEAKDGTEESNYIPRHGFAVSAPEMKLFREIFMNRNPRYKREPVG
jgi:hypothetical protein